MIKQDIGKKDIFFMILGKLYLCRNYTWKVDIFQLFYIKSLLIFIPPSFLEITFESCEILKMGRDDKIRGCSVQVSFLEINRVLAVLIGKIISKMSGKTDYFLPTRVRFNTLYVIRLACRPPPLHLLEDGSHFVY